MDENTVILDVEVSQDFFLGAATEKNIDQILEVRVIQNDNAPGPSMLQTSR
jgi:hypothetical protein